MIFATEIKELVSMIWLHDTIDLVAAFDLKRVVMKWKVLQPWVGQVLNALFHDNVITLF